MHIPPFQRKGVGWIPSAEKSQHHIEDLILIIEEWNLIKSENFTFSGS